jgi:hypothetical protein
MINEKIVDLVKKQINFSKRLFTVDIIDPRLYGTFLSESLFSYKEVFEYVDIIDENSTYLYDDDYKSKKVAAITYLAPYLNEIMLEKFFDISVRLKDPLNRLKASMSLYPFINKDMKNTLVNDVNDYVKNIDNNKILYLESVLSKIDDNEIEFKNILEILLNNFIETNDDDFYIVIKKYGKVLSKLFFDKIWGRCLEFDNLEYKLNSLIIIYLYNDNNKKDYLEIIFDILETFNAKELKNSFYYLGKLIKSTKEDNKEKILDKLNFSDKELYKSIDYIKYIVPTVSIAKLNELENELKSLKCSGEIYIEFVESIKAFPDYKIKWIEKTEKLLDKNFDNIDEFQLINKMILFTNNLDYDKKLKMQIKLIEKFEILLFESPQLAKNLNFEYIKNIIVEENIVKLINIFSKIPDIKFSIYLLSQLVIDSGKNFNDYKKLILKRILKKAESTLESLIFLKGFFYLIDLYPDDEGKLILNKIEEIYNNIGVAEEDLFSVNYIFTTSYAKYCDVIKVLTWRLITISSYKGDNLTKCQIDLDEKLAKSIVKSNKFDKNILKNTKSSFFKVRLLIELKKYKKALAEIYKIKSIFEKVICLIEIENSKKLNNILNTSNNLEIEEILCVIINLLEIEDLLFILSRIDFNISEKMLNTILYFIDSRNNISKVYKNKLILELTHKIPYKIFNNNKIVEKLLIEETVIYISNYVSINNDKFIKYIKTLPDDKYYIALNQLLKRSNKLIKSEINYIVEKESEYNKLKYVFEFLKYRHKKHLQSLINKWENPFQRLGGLYFINKKIEKSIIDEILILEKNMKMYLNSESLEVLLKIWNNLSIKEQEVILENILYKESFTHLEINLLIDLFKESTLEILTNIEFKVVKRLKEEYRLFFEFYFAILKFVEGEAFISKAKIVIDFIINYYILENKHIFLTQFRQDKIDGELNYYINKLNDIILEKLNKKDMEILMIKIMNESRMGIILTIKLLPVLKKLYGDKIILEMKNQMQEEFITEYKK